VSATRVPQLWKAAVAEPLVITIAHKLGKDEALRRIKPALGKASESFPVLSIDEETWSGDRMDFRVRALGQAGSGNLQVADEYVWLEVTLPWLLHKFGEVVTHRTAAPPPH
jgi:hypothetical protein